MPQPVYVTIILKYQIMFQTLLQVSVFLHHLQIALILRLLKLSNIKSPSFYVILFTLDNCSKRDTKAP